MPIFKRAKIIFQGKPTIVYNVKNLDSTFRGLKIILVKKYGGWFAYEKTTQISLTPQSWEGGLSHKTRNGILQIVSLHLQNASESLWEAAQKELSYKLKSPEGA